MELRAFPIGARRRRWAFTTRTLCQASSGSIRFIHLGSTRGYAGYLLSGKPTPTSGIPLKDVGLFQRYAQGSKAPAPLAAEVQKILTARA